MFKFAVAIVAATVAVAGSAPAFAADKQEAKVVERNGQTLYCVSQKVTGSRTPIRTCLTKEEWELRGASVASAKGDAQLAANRQEINQN